MKATATVMFTAATLTAATIIAGTPSRAEILALVNYESKPAEALKAYSTPVRGQNRLEGLAVIDIDPTSPNFNQIVKDVELPPDLVAHHIFYNRDASKAYLTALGKGELRVLDTADESMGLKIIAVLTARLAKTWCFPKTTLVGT